MPNRNAPTGGQGTALKWAFVAVVLGTCIVAAAELRPEWFFPPQAPPTPAVLRYEPASPAPRVSDAPPPTVARREPAPPAPAAPRPAPTPEARTAAIPAVPETQPDARRWIVDQLDRDMRDNPARREAALTRCVIVARGKGEIDWLTVMNCYRKLIAERPASR